MNPAKQPQQRLNIVMIGKSGMGKSSLGNSLCGKAAENFKTRVGQKSETQKLSTKQFRYPEEKNDAIHVTVADTPGFFQISDDQNKVKKEVQRSMIKMYDGVDAFLCCMKLTDRLTSENLKSLQQLTDVMGKQPIKSDKSAKLDNPDNYLESSPVDQWTYLVLTYYDEINGRSGMQKKIDKINFLNDYLDDEAKKFINKINGKAIFVQTGNELQLNNDMEIGKTARQEREEREKEEKKQKEEEEKKKEEKENEEKEEKNKEVKEKEEKEKEEKKQKEEKEKEEKKIKLLNDIKVIFFDNTYLTRAENLPKSKSHKAKKERDQAILQQKNIIDCIMEHQRLKGNRFTSEMFTELQCVMIITSLICLTIENPKAENGSTFRQLLRLKYSTAALEESEHDNLIVEFAALVHGKTFQLQHTNKAKVWLMWSSITATFGAVGLLGLLAAISGGGILGAVATFIGLGSTTVVTGAGGFGAGAVAAGGAAAFKGGDKAVIPFEKFTKFIEQFNEAILSTIANKLAAVGFVTQNDASSLESDPEISKFATALAKSIIAAYCYGFYGIMRE